MMDNHHCHDHNNELFEIIHLIMGFRAKLEEAYNTIESIKMDSIVCHDKCDKLEKELAEAKNKLEHNEAAFKNFIAKLKHKIEELKELLAASKNALNSDEESCHRFNTLRGNIDHILHSDDWMMIGWKDDCRIYRYS